MKLFRYLAVIPCIVFLLGIAIFPLLYSLAVTFHSWELVGAKTGWEFIGFDNYINIFTKDKEFWMTLYTTLLLTAGSLTSEFLIGLGLALLLNREIKGRRIFTTLLVLPMMTTPVVTGLIWRMLYHEKYGPINHVLGIFLGGWKEIPWLGNPSLAFISTLITNVWQWTPFSAMVLLAGLAAIPREPYESAQIDGASSVQIFRYISLPQLMPAVVVIVLLRLMDLLKLFDFIMMLTRGGPGIVTTTISIYIYLRAFKHWSIGYSCAQSYILLMVIVTLTTIFLRILRRRT